MCGIGLIAERTDTEGTPPVDFALMRGELAKRGPDGSGELSLHAGEFRLTFIGSVLGLRGREVVRQPVQDDDGNVLLWNGEVFGGIEIGLDENDTGLMLTLLRKCASTTAVVELLDKIQGPFAFVYWQARTKQLFFGKDKLGRRSLLLHRPSSKSDPFILSSVAVFPFQDEEKQHSQADEKSTVNEEEEEDDEVEEAGQFWEEVDTASLYLLDLAASGTDEVYAEDAQFLEPGIRLIRLEKRSLFPFGRRTLIEPVEEQSDHVQKDEAIIDAFVEVLKQAMAKRLSNLPHSSTTESRVGVLFSGGLDSIVLARLADLFLPPEESIDLLNVAFAAQTTEAKPTPKKQSKKAKRKGQSQNTTTSTSDVQHKSPYDAVPDRQTGIRGWNELRSASPSRKWNFVEVNVLASELHEHHNQIMQLLHPSKSLMDHSIAAATWFAARGKGVIRSDQSLLASIGCDDASARYAEVPIDPTAKLVYQNSSNLECEPAREYTSTARVLLIGSGADEQFGGYGRHRTAFRKGGWPALQQELEKDTTRLWKRNLGRDDRVISSTGRESRIPYLDEEVIKFLNQTPLWEVCDMRLKPGVGDKALLREAGRRLGLTASTLLVKRAIQFGSRIAKVSQPTNSSGGRRKIKGADGISLALRPNPAPRESPAT